MPFVNGAPLDAQGRIIVTTTTPTAAWPSRGGMTYHPTTGELAVIDAVPAVNDPRIGGIAFTNLGAMYVTSTLPSPLFYDGGLPVSSDGRLFMSSSPPVGSVGGWPVGGDGGVAGIGLSPVPIFWAPLLTTLVPVLAGNPAFTFTRATTAYVADQDGILRQAIANEARFQGARRVRNRMILNTNNLTVGYTLEQSPTVTFGALGPTGQADATTFTSTLPNGAIYTNTTTTIPGTFVNSLWLRRRTGTGQVDILTPGAAHINVTAQLDGTWRRFSSISAVGQATNAFVGIAVLAAGDAVDITYLQVEDISGQSNQAPGDYVSVGVLAAPWHGAGVDGVRYSALTNGNSVAGNIVTEAQGTLIPTATLLGYVAENAATNLCLQSQTFDNAAWTKQFSAITADNIAAPDGTLTADRFTDDVTGNAHNMFQGIAVTAQPYTFSAYVKQGTLPWVQLNGASPNAYANFNLATGAIGFTANCTTSVTSLPNGWYRVSITTTPTAGTWFPAITSINANTNSYAPAYSGTGQTMYLWGAQVEASSDPSSYVPTTTVAVTRAGDVLSYPAATNIATVGVPYTAYLEAAYVTHDTAAQMLLGASTVFQLYFRGAGGVNGIDFFSNGGTTSGSKVLSVAARAALTKYACRKNTGTLDLDVFSSGVKGTTGAQGTQGAEITAIQIAATSNGNQLNGTARNVKIYNVALTDAELIAMTT